MTNYDTALKEAMANSSIEQSPLNQEKIEIIRQALVIAERTGNSFLLSLIELTEQIINEEQRNKSI